jgi:hypothetical protein
MIEINLSIQNILDGRGIEIAIIGMLVVFTALILISAFIALLPSVLRIVNLIYPVKDSGFLSECPDTPEDEVLLQSVLFYTLLKLGSKFMKIKKQRGKMFYCISTLVKTMHFQCKAFSCFFKFVDNKLIKNGYVNYTVFSLRVYSPSE